ncbi:hypothetical protein ASF40_09185 [Microbacterium sp. Leaf288]|uniref:ABC transporter substrate-binding protein n=1 Tax=Microbacterium sp. Leaf288 TaxID=1736323 RepID=UPI0006F41E19|nr:ABC transporter substrate-binding protein [Microbacterium sp. Leaf288]KQP70001.1 hypothetical protein ASF40_09185 [Microbacterium sp. Leaf288]
MTLRLSQFIPVVPLTFAVDAGLVGDLDLDTVITTGSAQQIDDLARNEADVVVTAIDNLFAWSQVVPDLRLIAQVEHTMTLRVYARPEFHRLEDLAGARFSVDARANGFSLLARRMLADRHVDVEFVEHGGVHNRLAALVAGHADATLLIPAFGSAAEDAGMNFVTSVDALIPGLPGQALVGRESVTARDGLVAFLRALEAGVAVSSTLSDEAGIRTLERHDYGVGAEDAWRTRPRTLDVSQHGLQLLTDVRRSLGLLPPGADLEALIDGRPLDAARH